MYRREATPNMVQYYPVVRMRIGQLTQYADNGVMLTAKESLLFSEMVQYR